MYKLFLPKASLWYNIKQLRYLPYAIKYRWQRAWRGWANCDTWNMDGWFEEVIPQMLQYLKDNKNGYPIIDLSIPEEDNNKLWDDILDRMIYLCKEMNEETCSQQNEIWEDYWNKKNSGIESNLDCGAYINRREEIKAYRDRCRKEFFDLFCEHFERLWD